VLLLGLEHTAILGDTVEKIAWEKGGIIKPGVPAIIGRTVPRDVVTKVHRRAASIRHT
jgi:folylpolyglutamate synthase/dihydropteroate synthase